MQGFLGNKDFLGSNIRAQISTLKSSNKRVEQTPRCLFELHKAMLMKTVLIQFAMGHSTYREPHEAVYEGDACECWRGDCPAGGVLPCTARWY